MDRRCVCALVGIVGLSLAARAAQSEGRPRSAANKGKAPFCDIVLLGCHRPSIFDLPLHQDDTLIDVVARVPGLPSLMSNKEIWVARPSSESAGTYEILLVDWKGIVKQGNSLTNYLLHSGDRIYIKAREVKQEGQGSGSAKPEKKGKAEQVGENPSGSKSSSLPVQSCTKATTTGHKPPYVIEPPDILSISFSHGRPRSSDRTGPAMGIHLVRPDGTISLGTYGYVFVAGLSVAEARTRIEHHLAKWVQEPVVSVDIFSYNSKHYFIIVEGEGDREQVICCPITGNETVLDAVSPSHVRSHISLHTKMWLARPNSSARDGDQVLLIDWKGITTAGETVTNFQLLPGDRIYIETGKVGQAEKGSGAAETKKGR